MLAGRVYGKGDLRVEEIDIPETVKGGMRIRVKACCICGSDKRILKKGDFRAHFPVTIGHEIAGIVDEVDGIEDFKAGDRVCVAPGYACGRCRNCVQGKPHICLNPYPSVGYAINGGFAEYMSVPAHLYRMGFINKIPDDLSDAEASLAEIVACALNGQDKCKVKPGDFVLILGAGPAGIIHARLSKMFGAANVTLAQRGKVRLEKAAELFPEAVDDTICMADVDIEKEYLKRSGGRQPDVVIVCAAANEAQELACRMIAPGGRINFFAGLPADDPYIRLNANDVHYKEIYISGSSSSRQQDNVTALQLLSQRIIDGKRLITDHFALKDIQEAFKRSDEKESFKVVIEM